MKSKKLKITVSGEEYETTIFKILDISKLEKIVFGDTTLVFNNILVKKPPVSYHNHKANLEILTYDFTAEGILGKKIKHEK